MEKGKSANEVEGEEEGVLTSSNFRGCHAFFISNVFYSNWARSFQPDQLFWCHAVVAWHQHDDKLPQRDLGHQGGLGSCRRCWTGTFWKEKIWWRPYVHVARHERVFIRKDIIIIGDDAERAIHCDGSCSAYCLGTYQNGIGVSSSSDPQHQGSILLPASPIWTRNHYSAAELVEITVHDLNHAKRYHFPIRKYLVVMLPWREGSW